MIQKPNSIIILLFIQNNSYILKQAKTCLHLQLPFCLSASLREKGMIKYCADILQTSDVVRRVVFLLFLLCLWPIVRLFLPRETSEMFRHFVLTTKKTTQPRPHVFSVNCPVFWQLCCRIHVIFHIS